MCVGTEQSLDNISGLKSTDRFWLTRRWDSFLNITPGNFFVRLLSQFCVPRLINTTIENFIVRKILIQNCLYWARHILNCRLFRISAKTSCELLYYYYNTNRCLSILRDCNPWDKIQSTVLIYQFDETTLLERSIVVSRCFILSICDTSVWLLTSSFTMYRQYIRSLPLTDESTCDESLFGQFETYLITTLRIKAGKFYMRDTVNESRLNRCVNQSIWSSRQHLHQVTRSCLFMR